MVRLCIALYHLIIFAAYIFNYDSQWLYMFIISEYSYLIRLVNNFRMCGTNFRKLTQESQQFEGHFLAIVEDTWHVADRLIDSEGNCICEDCMTAEFKQGIFANAVKHPVGPNDRLIMCNICREILALDLLGSHFGTEHADLNIPRADTTKSYKCKFNLFILFFLNFQSL